MIQPGFKNRNGGYDSWLEWCNTLYEPDAYYNVYDRRLTLRQFKDNGGGIGVRVAEGWALSDSPLSAK